MGCTSSKSRLVTVDDSVHTMLKHEKKVAAMHGEKPKGYVPRAPHPLLEPVQRAAITATEEEDEQQQAGAQSQQAVTTGATPS